MRAAGVPARIVVGPWLHGEPARAAGDRPPGRRRGWTTTCAAARPRGASRCGSSCSRPAPWLEFAEWPPAPARPVVLLPAGRRRPEPTTPAADEAAPEHVRYDPADPTPSAGGPLLQPPGKQVDNRAIEARPDVLTFTSDPAAGRPRPGRPGQRPGLRAHRASSTPTCSSGSVTSTCRASPATSSTASAGSTRGRSRRRTWPSATTGVLAVDVELFPTAYRVGPGTGSGCRSAAGASRASPATSGTAEPFGTATTARRPVRGLPRPGPPLAAAAVGAALTGAGASRLPLRRQPRSGRCRP